MSGVFTVFDTKFILQIQDQINFNIKFKFEETSYGN